MAGERPNQKAKWRDSMKPTDFSGVKGRVDKLDAYSSEYKNRATGLFTVGVLNGRSGVDPESVRTLDFRNFVQQYGTRPSREDIIDVYKATAPEYENVTPNRIITLKSKPRVEFNKQGKLAQASESNTMQTMIKQFIKDCNNIQKQTLTVKNIVELVQNSTYTPNSSAQNKIDQREFNYRAAAKQKQTPLLASILKAYVAKPDQGQAMYPFQIVPNVSQLPKEYATAVANSISIDFGEIIGPVALVTGNATGNAARVFKDFFGVTGVKDLMKSATIHFNAGATDPLYDSFIEYGGRVVGLSSKGHHGGGAASAGTSISSLAHAIQEVRSNPTAIKLLAKLLKDPQNRQMFDIVSILATDSNHGQKYDKTLRLLQLLNPQEYPKQSMYSDLRVLRSLGKNKSKVSRLNGFSDYVKAKMASGPGRNRDDKTVFDKMMRTTNTAITQQLNQNKKFSEICTWILNHSATVQIDLYTSKDGGTNLDEARAQYGGALVLTNIVATWPSTRVDTIELLENNKDLRFMLGVNGYSARFGDPAQVPWTDTDFKDSIKAKPGDRDFSDVTSAKDWANQGVNVPRNGTNTDDLPTNNTPPADWAPMSKTKTRTPGQRRTSTPQSSSPQTAVQKMRRFIAVTGIVKNENSPLKTGNKVFAYATGIMNGSVQFPDNYVAAFRELVQDEEVKKLVNKATKLLNGHPQEVDTLYENLLDDSSMIVNVIAVLYWVYMAKQYEQGYPQFRQQALDNAKRFMHELNITDKDVEHRKQARTIDNITEIKR